MYTNEYLLDKLREIWLKYGKIQTQLIDNEPNFPTRKCYIRAFGSLENAYKIIGYTDYQKRTFTIDDAQKVLDKRNGHFKLLNFNGMRNKCTVQCKICGFIFDALPDSLLRNKTEEHFGCKNCNNKTYKSSKAIQIIKETLVQYSLKEIQEKFPYKKDYGYIYEIVNLKNNKRYIGSTNNPYQRWKQHIRASYTKDNISYNYPLQCAIRKYGVNNFVFSVILYDIPINKLAKAEKDAIIKYNSLVNEGWGYNQTLETECALRDSQVKIKGNSCALVDEQNNIIRIFGSYHDASRILFGNADKATHICAVCNGKRKTCNKMKFIKIKGDDEIVQDLLHK